MRNPIKATAREPINRPDTYERFPKSCRFLDCEQQPAHTKWPGANSKVIDVYLLGEPISLTGRCKSIVTNVSFHIDGHGSTSWKYAQMKKANVWCQMMTTDAELGWARGKYIWPE